MRDILTKTWKRLSYLWMKWSSRLEIKHLFFLWTNKLNHFPDVELLLWVQITSVPSTTAHSCYVHYFVMRCCRLWHCCLVYHCVVCDVNLHKMMWTFPVSTCPLVHVWGSGVRLAPGIRLRYGTHYPMIWKTLIFLCQPLNAILRPFSLCISTPSAFKVFHKNVLYKLTVIISDWQKEPS